MNTRYADILKDNIHTFCYIFSALSLTEFISSSILKNACESLSCSKCIFLSTTVGGSCRAWPEAL
jgi:hypothetical protein